MCVFDSPPPPPPPPPVIPPQDPIQTMKSPEANKDRGETTAGVRSAALGRKALRSPGTGLTIDTGSQTGSGLNIQ